MMVVDFHSHILPGIDDGSASLRESMKMLQMEAEQGVECVVATPHFYARHDSPERFLQRRLEAETILRKKIEQYEGVPRVIVGAEVYYYSGMSESESLQKLVIGDTKYILVEMPMPPWTEQMYEELRKIQSRQGLTPIIAHIDRYIGPFRTYKIPDKLAELPVLVQANANFFLRRSTEKMALRLLREGKIHLLGSDCHNLKDRAVNLESAVKKIRQQLGRRMIRRINSYETDILQLDM